MNKPSDPKNNPAIRPVLQTSRGFWDGSSILDYMVLRPLAHIRSAWDITWDEESNSYLEEPDSFAGLLNSLIAELATINPPIRYHDNEDRLAEYVQTHLNWRIHKAGNRWVGVDYESILAQGGFGDSDQGELLLAASGRVKAARDRGQLHFDDMEQSHQRMLAAVLTIVLWHRDSLE
jgi:hypothetical protein